MNYTYISNSAENTLTFAKNLAAKLKPKDVIVLTGELGSGKTKFVEGILSYFNLQDEISSPTFTIVNEYQTTKFPIYHFDVYRISDPEEMYEIGFEEYIEGEGVCFIEWANLIEELLPEQYTELHIDKDLSKGFDYRLITVEQVQR